MSDQTNRDKDYVEQVFGAHRIQYEPPVKGKKKKEFLQNEAQDEQNTLNMLSRAINVGRVIAFVGSGVSRNYGYPDWRGLSNKIIKQSIVYWELWAPKINESSDPKQNTFLLKKFLRDFTENPKEITNESLIQWLGVAKRLIDNIDEFRLWKFNTGIKVRDTSPLHLSKNKDGKPYIGQFFRYIIEVELGKGSDPRKQNFDPLEIIIRDLEITRFVTTNFDRTVVEKLKEYASDLHFSPLTPKINEVDQIIQFSSRKNIRQAGVLHLHGIANEKGKYDSQQSPLIISDKEYQRTYYSNEDDEPLRSYRSAIAHLFRSNAFLFIGTALSENEVIRPLRMLASERENHPTPRELFALLFDDKYSLRERSDLRNFLYYTYGVKSIFYKLEDTEDQPEAFCRKLKVIVDARRAWWERWRDTPVIRFPVYRTEDAKKNETSSNIRKKLRKDRNFCSVRHKLIPCQNLWESSSKKEERKSVRRFSRRYINPKSWSELKKHRSDENNLRKISSEHCIYKSTSILFEKRTTEKLNNFYDQNSERDSNVMVICGSNGSGKGQAEEFIQKYYSDRNTDNSNSHTLIAGTTYHSFDFQSLIGYFYDHIVKDKDDKNDHSSHIDSISRFKNVLNSLKRNQTLLIGGLDNLLTNKEPVTKYLFEQNDANFSSDDNPSLNDLLPITSTDQIETGQPSNHAISNILDFILDFSKGARKDSGNVILIGSAVPSSFLSQGKHIDFCRLRKIKQKEFVYFSYLGEFIIKNRKSKFLRNKRKKSLQILHLLELIAQHVDCDIYPLTVLDRYLASLLHGQGGKNSRFEFVCNESFEFLTSLEGYLSARSRDEKSGRLVEHIITEMDNFFDKNIRYDSQNNLVPYLHIYNHLDDLLKEAKKINWEEGYKITLTDILQRVSMFTLPVTSLATAASFNLHRFGPGKSKQIVKMFGNLLNDLAKLNLLFQVEPAPRRGWEKSSGGISRERYVTHRLVRRGMLRRLGDAPTLRPDQRQFIAATFAAEPVSKPTQTVEGYSKAGQSLDSLLSYLEQVDRWEKYGNFRAPSRNSIRAAFGLLRTCWDAVSLPNLQLDDFEGQFPAAERSHLLDGYLERLSRIVNLLSRSSQIANDWDKKNFADTRGLWRDGEEHQWSLNGVLYGHELTWFFNELGMASFVHGPLNDAYPFFEIALKLTNVMNRADSNADAAVAAEGAFGTRWATVHANLAMVKLERGGLHEALREFEVVSEGLKNFGPPASFRRNQGWIARLYYFLGRKDEALALYDEIFSEKKTPLNTRARSMFLRHRAEVHRSHNNLSEAHRDLNDSYAIASSADHRDQMHTTAVSRIYTEFRENPASGSFKQIDPHIVFARRSGLLKLEANFYRAQARIALRQGYPDVAWRLALRSTEISNYNGVLLDLTASLIVLGQAAADLMGPKVSKRILQDALSMATRQHYVQQRTVAEEALHQLEFGARRPTLAFSNTPRVGPPSYGGA